MPHDDVAAAEIHQHLHRHLAGVSTRWVLRGVLRTQRQGAASDGRGHRRKINERRTNDGFRTHAGVEAFQDTVHQQADILKTAVHFPVPRDYRPAHGWIA